MKSLLVWSIAICKEVARMERSSKDRKGVTRIVKDWKEVARMVKEYQRSQRSSKDGKGVARIANANLSTLTHSA